MYLKLIFLTIQADISIKGTENVAIRMPWLLFLLRWASPVLVCRERILVQIKIIVVIYASTQY